MLFTLIDTPIFLNFFFLYANVGLIRLITHSSLGSVPACSADEGGIHGPATVPERLVASRAVSAVDANDRKQV